MLTFFDVWYAPRYTTRVVALALAQRNFTRLTSPGDSRHRLTLPPILPLFQRSARAYLRLLIRHRIRRARERLQEDERQRNNNI